MLQVDTDGTSQAVVGEQSTEPIHRGRLPPIDCSKLNPEWVERVPVDGGYPVQPGTGSPPKTI
jgi:hypothetical protein